MAYLTKKTWLGDAVFEIIEKAARSLTLTDIYTTGNQWTPRSVSQVSH